ncbi:MAG: YifB family Mg chelatase-like AAA ATPase [Spirochaetales bacterium]
MFFLLLYANNYNKEYVSEDSIKIISFSPFGYEGALVAVEVDLRRGIPAVDLVGLADNAVKEARERMRVAIHNSGFEFPLERVLISLSPADVKKEGAGFDLPIALAVLQEKFVKDHVDKPENDMCFDENVPILVMGELELSGRIRPVRGVHAALSTAFENGIRCCIIPEENAPETAGLKHIKIFTVRHLEKAFQLFIALNNKSFFEKLNSDEKKSIIAQSQSDDIEFPETSGTFDYSDVRGQADFLRALQVAAAGLHNIMAYGPPGCGKTLALQHFADLLPLLTEEDALPVTRIYSLAGKLQAGTKLVREAPFRMPHQSSSLEGMIGGGPLCRPGEISLAHNGVLFLDEASEFRSSVLQTLRVPLEDGKITLSRAGRNTEFPARFQLLVASNPCPCGNFGSQEKICLCSARSVEQFWRKFSAPLLDRLDIRVALGKADFDKSDSQKNYRVISTDELRKEIKKATRIQRSRQGKSNSRLNPTEIKLFCQTDEQSERYLHSQSLRYGFSARGLHCCLKLARTIADMAESSLIQFSHIEEAVFLHRNDGGAGFMF